MSSPASSHHKEVTRIMLYLIPQQTQPEAPDKAEKAHLAMAHKPRNARRQRRLNLLRSLVFGHQR